MDKTDPILKVRDIKVNFTIRNNQWFWQKPSILKAVNGINFDLHTGETLGIVGESGCGKSTLARALIGLNTIQSGSVIWNNQDITQLAHHQLKEVRKDIQMIFQDPLASLNPRMTVGDIIAEPLVNYYPKKPKEKIIEEVRNIMAKVGLLPNVINRYPHEFSGGQCQRIGIARALILKPKLIICDEPVSALDVSIQAQVINLLKKLQTEMGLSLIFIAHDLSIIKHISDRILVMYLGNEMELALAESIYDTPHHPYTKALLSAVPIPDPKLERNKTIQLLEGDLPSPINPPTGCVFRTRCPEASELCTQKPAIYTVKKQHTVRCIKYKT